MQKQLLNTCMPEVRGGQTFSTKRRIGKNVKAEGRSAWKSKAKKRSSPGANPQSFGGGM